MAPQSPVPTATTTAAPVKPSPQAGLIWAILTLVMVVTTGAVFLATSVSSQDFDDAFYWVFPMDAVMPIVALFIADALLAVATVWWVIRAYAYFGRADA